MGLLCVIQERELMDKNKQEVLTWLILTLKAMRFLASFMFFQEQRYHSCQVKDWREISVLLSLIKASRLLRHNLGRIGGNAQKSVGTRNTF